MNRLKIKDLVAAIEDIAPLYLQEKWDNSGFLIGSMENEVSRVLLSLDVTEDIVNEAIEIGAEMIIAHHPIIFPAIKNLTDSTSIGRAISRAIKGNLNIFCAHTNLDKAPINVSNFALKKMSEHAKMSDIKPLVPEGDGSIGFGAIAVFENEISPENFLNLVRKTFEPLMIRHTKLPQKAIKKIAFCGGSGADFIKDAIDQNADVYLTSDIKYHQFLDNSDAIFLVDISHFNSEKFAVEIFYDAISKKYTNFALSLSKLHTDPVFNTL